VTSLGRGLRSTAGSFAGSDGVEVSFRVHRRTLATSGKAVREVFDYGKRDWDEDETNGGREEHSANNDGAKDAARGAACSTRSPEWEASEDEGQRRHDDGTEAQASCPKGGFRNTLTAFVVGLCEFDDEDGVLGGEANQHDQTDGRKDVVFKQSYMECDVRSKNRDGSAEENAKGQCPARIERRKDEEDEEQGEREDGPGGHALCRLLFLVGHAGVVVATARRHGLREGIFKCCSDLARTVAGSTGDVDLRRIEFIEESGTCPPLALRT